MALFFFLLGRTKVHQRSEDSSPSPGFVTCSMILKKSLLSLEFSVFVNRKTGRGVSKSCKPSPAIKSRDDQKTR